MVLGDILGDVYRRAHDRMTLSKYECADKWAREDLAKFRSAGAMLLCKEAVAKILVGVKEEALKPELVPVTPIKVVLLGRDAMAKGSVINHLLQLSASADQPTSSSARRAEGDGDVGKVPSEPVTPVSDGHTLEQTVEQPTKQTVEQPTEQTVEQATKQGGRSLRKETSSSSLTSPSSKPRATAGGFLSALSLSAGDDAASRYAQLEQEDFGCPEHALSGHVLLVDAPDCADIGVVSRWLEDHKILSEAHAVVLVVSGRHGAAEGAAQGAAQGATQGAEQEAALRAARGEAQGAAQPCPGPGAGSCDGGEEGTGDLSREGSAWEQQLWDYGDVERTILALFSMLARPAYVLRTRPSTPQPQGSFQDFRAMCLEDGAEDVFHWDAEPSEGREGGGNGGWPRKRTTAEHEEMSLFRLHWAMCHDVPREVFLRRAMRCSLTRVFGAAVPYNLAWMFFSRSLGSLVPGLNLLQTVRDALASCHRMCIEAGFIPDPKDASAEAQREKGVTERSTQSGGRGMLQGAADSDAAAGTSAGGEQAMEGGGKAANNCAGSSAWGDAEGTGQEPSAEQGSKGDEAGQELQGPEQTKAAETEKDLAKAIADALEHGKAEEKPPNENQKMAAAFAMKSTLASGAADQVADLYQWILLGAILEGGIENLAEVALGATIPLVAGTMAAATAYTQHAEMVSRFTDRALLVYLKLMRDEGGIIAKRTRILKDACMAKVMAPECLALFRELEEGDVQTP